MTRVAIVPLTREQSQQFIADHHRHHQPAIGDVFRLGAALGETVVGVATVGRPVARHFDDGWTLEVNRTCVADGAPHGVNSLLYARAWKVAKLLGWRRLITYTQAGESGASLRGAGWRVIADRPARPGWDMPSRPRVPTGAERVQRTLWEAV